MNPYGVAYDPCSRSLFFSDTMTNLVRVLRTDGRVYTVAGIPPGSAGGYIADFVPGTTVRLQAPRGLFVDMQANALLIADYGSHVVRSVDLSTGLMHRVAGNYADGLGAPVAEGAVATDVSLSFPSDVLVVNGTLFVADSGTHSVYAVPQAGGAIFRLIGNGTAANAGDNGTAADATMRSPIALAYVPWTHSVLVSDNIAATIRAVRCAPTAAVAASLRLGPQLFVGGPLADPASYQPAACPNRGSLTPTICPAGGSAVSTWAGTGVSGLGTDGVAATASALNGPVAVVYDPRTASTFISNSASHLVTVVDASGNMSVAIGVRGASGRTGDGGDARAATLNSPTGLALDDLGRVLYVVDGGNALIRAYSIPPQGSGVLTTVVGAGIGPGPYSCADGTPALQCNFAGALYAAAWDPCRRQLYFGEDDWVVRVWRPGDGKLYTIAGVVGSGVSGLNNVPATSTLLRQPRCLVMDASADALYICESAKASVRKVALATGLLTRVAGNGSVVGAGTRIADGSVATAVSLSSTTGAVLLGGVLIVSDGTARAVYAVSADGLIYNLIGNTSQPAANSGDGGPAESAQLHYPLGLGFHPPSGKLLICDGAAASVVRAVACSPRPGLSLTVAPTRCPALAPSVNPLICPAGVSNVTTWAGTGVAAKGPFGVLATRSGLYGPTALAFDPVTNSTYISNIASHVVVVVNATGFARIAAGVYNVGAFNGDGGDALATALDSPSGVAIDVVGRVLMIVESQAARIRAYFYPAHRQRYGAGPRGQRDDDRVLLSRRHPRPVLQVRRRRPRQRRLGRLPRPAVLCGGLWRRAHLAPVRRQDLHRRRYAGSGAAGAVRCLGDVRGARDPARPLS
jgi:hypothetical protein